MCEGLEDEVVEVERIEVRVLDGSAGAEVSADLCLICLSADLLVALLTSDVLMGKSHVEQINMVASAFTARH